MTLALTLIPTLAISLTAAAANPSPLYNHSLDYTYKHYIDCKDDT